MLNTGIIWKRGRELNRPPTEEDVELGLAKIRVSGTMDLVEGAGVRVESGRLVYYGGKPRLFNQCD